MPPFKQSDSSMQMRTDVFKKKKNSAHFIMQFHVSATDGNRETKVMQCTFNK